MQRSETAPKRWWLLVALGFFAFMTNLDGSIVNIAVPIMAKDLKVPTSQMEWTVSLYLIVLSALLLPFGKLGDRIGKQRIFKWGTGTFVLGSLMAGINLGFNFLMLARMIQALGGAMTLANTYGIVTSTFALAERGRAMGVVSTFVALGGVAGPSLGGLILAHFSWPMIFLINVPIGLIALGVSLWSMNNGVPQRGAYDGWGMILQATAIASGFWGLNLSQQNGFDDPVVLSTLALAVVALIAFIVFEQRQQAPLLPLRIFRVRIFTLGVVTVFFIFMVQFFSTVLMPFYLEDARGLTPGTAGTLLSLYPLMMVFFAPFGGWLADKWNVPAVALLGSIFIAVGSLIGAALKLNAPLTIYIISTLLVGIGSGLFQSPIGDVVMSVVPKNQLGIAGSFNALARNLGMVSGTAVATTVLFGTMSQLAGSRVTNYPTAHPEFFISGLQVAMIVAAVLAILGAIAIGLTIKPWQAHEKN